MNIISYLRINLGRIKLVLNVAIHYLVSHYDYSNVQNLYFICHRNSHNLIKILRLHDLRN